VGGGKKERPKVVVIAGPTASGKTALGVALAETLGGEIINADSMQVYRGMDIGTAKPARAERKGIPHHLLDVVDPDQEFNAAIYRSRAMPLVREIHERQRVCFLVGGTGLYIKALIGGLFPGPKADEAFRESLRRECELCGTERVYERLKRLDPESAKRIHPKDRVRLIRALEIIHVKGLRPSDLQAHHGFRERPFRVLKLYLDMDRQGLYERINRRSVDMIEAGLVEETKRLLNEGYSAELKPMKSIGYRHMVKYIQSEWSLEEALRGLQRDTRRYAKRQWTWYKADREALWIPHEAFETALREAEGFLKSP